MRADRESDAAERFEQILGLEGLVAREIDVRDGGALFDHHHEGAAVALDPNVVEEPGREQPLDGRRGVLRVDLVADGDRKLVEYRAGGDPPQALHPNVLDHERLRERDGRKNRCQARHQAHPQAHRGQALEESAAHQLRSLITSL